MGPIRTGRRLCRDTGGATAIEYALMAGFIGGAIAVTVFTLGGTVFADYYQTIADALLAQKG